MSDLSSCAIVYEVASAVVYRVQSVGNREKEKICGGPLRALRASDGTLLLAVGPDLSRVYFSYQLPGCFCIMTGDVVNCPSNEIGLFVSIVLRDHGVGTMDEFGVYLADQGCVVQEARYESSTETWALRFRKAGDGAGTLVAGAGRLASRGIEKLGSGVRNRIESNSASGKEPVKVPDGVHKGLRYARSATLAAANVATKVVSAVGQAASNAASTAFDDDPDKINPHNPHGQRTGGQKTIVLAKSAVAATCNVWGNMVDVESEVISKTAEETAKTISHAHGDDAGSAARDGMHIVGNVVDAAKQLKGKALIKSVGKGAVQGALGKDSLHEQLRPEAGGAPIDFAPAEPTTTNDKGEGGGADDDADEAKGGSAREGGPSGVLDWGGDDVVVVNMAHA